MQLVVPGNTWKAGYLLEGDFSLITEAVSPGF
jgi:predicted cupin superfamily sugar epimerase